MKKKYTVGFANIKLREAYEALKHGRKEERFLFKKISNAIEKFGIMPFYGAQVPKRLIPKEYINKYSVQNLWKINLNGGWRLIYTIVGTETEMTSIILEWMTHKKYERKFKY
jgi:Txe/YoeB family toxin of Txe-Axe toxin-antitoxin module